MSYKIACRIRLTARAPVRQSRYGTSDEQRVQYRAAGNGRSLAIYLEPRGRSAGWQRRHAALLSLFRLHLGIVLYYYTLVAFKNCCTRRDARLNVIYPVISMRRIYTQCPYSRATMVEPAGYNASGVRVNTARSITWRVYRELAESQPPEYRRRSAAGNER